MSSSYNDPSGSSPAFAAMSDAILAIAAELSIDAVLKKIVDSARRLADARYAALGVPDNRGAFAEFITSGMSAKQQGVDVQRKGQRNRPAIMSVVAVSSQLSFGSVLEYVPRPVREALWATVMVSRSEQSSPWINGQP
jgi:hypothetical protein